MQEGVDVGVAEVAVELMVRVVLRCRRRVEVRRNIFWKRGKQAGELVEVNIAKMFGVSLRPCDWSSHFVASVNFSGL